MRINTAELRTLINGRSFLKISLILIAGFTGIEFARRNPFLVSQAMGGLLVGGIPIILGDLAFTRIAKRNKGLIESPLFKTYVEWRITAGLMLVSFLTNGVASIPTTNTPK